MTTENPFSTVAPAAKKPRPKAKKRTASANAWAHTTTTGHCADCGQPTLQALESADIHIRNTADPHTLTSAQELTALLAGRHTYTLDPRARTLQRRTVYQIRGHPPEHDPQPVLPQHHCHQPLGTPLPPTPPPKETRTDDAPPF